MSIREEFLGLPEVYLRIQALIQKDLLTEDEIFDLEALTAHRNELLRLKALKEK